MSIGGMKEITRHGILLCQQAGALVSQPPVPGSSMPAIGVTALNRFRSNECRASELRGQVIAAPICASRLIPREAWEWAVAGGHFSIRRFKVKRFRAVLPLRCLMSLAGPCFSSGSALWLSHDGIRRMRRSNLLRVLIAPGAIDTSALANSPHPSSREGRLSTGWRKLVYLSVRATGCSTGPIRRSPQHPPSSSGTRCRRSKGGA